MKLYCPILVGEQYLPARCMHRTMQDGRDASPPLLWSDAPAAVKSFSLQISDLDAGTAPLSLWVLINIPFAVRELYENASLVTKFIPGGSVQLTNSQGNQRYDGPNLARDAEPHRITIELFALSVDRLNIGVFSSAEERLNVIGQKTIQKVALEVLATRSR
ncbi:MAG: YbhB/YbcL family Raf kinase inhibitor-like protein [Bacteroidota bacterium]